jgi:hypothetical protein
MGKSMIENDQLVTFSTFRCDAPRFEGSAIIRRDKEIPPASHPMVVGVLEEEAAERPDDVGDGGTFA